MRVAGLAPAVALDADDAIEALGRYAPEAVVLDMATPRLSTARLVRHARQTRRPPALIVVAADRRESVQIALLRK
jgi:DNA-binding response OmpR family regulator